MCREVIPLLCFLKSSYYVPEVKLIREVYAKYTLLPILNKSQRQIMTEASLFLIINVCLFFNTPQPKGGRLNGN